MSGFHDRGLGAVVELVEHYKGYFMLFSYSGAAVTMDVDRTETSIRVIKKKIGRTLYSMY